MEHRQEKINLAKAAIMNLFTQKGMNLEQAKNSTEQFVHAVVDSILFVGAECVALQRALEAGQWCITHKMTKSVKEEMLFGRVVIVLVKPGKVGCKKLAGPVDLVLPHFVRCLREDAVLAESALCCGQALLARILRDEGVDNELVLRLTGITPAWLAKVQWPEFWTLACTSVLDSAPRARRAPRAPNDRRAVEFALAFSLQANDPFRLISSVLQGMCDERSPFRLLISRYEAGEEFSELRWAREMLETAGDIPSGKVVARPLHVLSPPEFHSWRAQMGHDDLLSRFFSLHSDEEGWLVHAAGVRFSELRREVCRFFPVWRTTMPLDPFAVMLVPRTSASLLRQLLVWQAHSGTVPGARRAGGSTRWKAGPSALFAAAGVQEAMRALEVDQDCEFELVKLACCMMSYLMLTLGISRMRMQEVQVTGSNIQDMGRAVRRYLQLAPQILDSSLAAASLETTWAMALEHRLAPSESSHAFFGQAASGLLAVCSAFSGSAGIYMGRAELLDLDGHFQKPGYPPGDLFVDLREVLGQNVKFLKLQKRDLARRMLKGLFFDLEISTSMLISVLKTLVPLEFQDAASSWSQYVQKNKVCHAKGMVFSDADPVEVKLPCFTFGLLFELWAASCWRCMDCSPCDTRGRFFGRGDLCPDQVLAATGISFDEVLYLKENFPLFERAPLRQVEAMINLLDHW